MEEIYKYLTRPDGTTVGYRIRRGATPRPLLIMIHGLASNLTRWSEFAEHSSLNDGWDMMRIDLRGHGSSMTYARFDQEMWRDDLAAIMRHEGYDKAVIAGHSLGAQVGIYFHSAYPGHCRGLIMIDPVFPDNLSGRLLKARKWAWLVRIAAGALRLIGRSGLRRRSFEYRDLRMLDEQTRAYLEANPDKTIGSLYTNPLADFRYIPLANYLNDLLEVTRPLPSLEAINVPVLVLLSAGASVSDPARNQAEIDRMPQVTTTVLDADHWLLTERPVEARQTIDSWCNNLATDN